MLLHGRPRCRRSDDPGTRQDTETRAAGWIPFKSPWTQIRTAYSKNAGELQKSIERTTSMFSF